MLPATVRAVFDLVSDSEALAHERNFDAFASDDGSRCTETVRCCYLLKLQ
jgi:hypothetical protein